MPDLHVFELALCRFLTPPAAFLTVTIPFPRAPAAFIRWKPPEIPDPGAKVNGALQSFEPVEGGDIILAQRS